MLYILYTHTLNSGNTRDLLVIINCFHFKLEYGVGKRWLLLDARISILPIFRRDATNFFKSTRTLNIS